MYLGGYSLYWRRYGTLLNARKELFHKHRSIGEAGFNGIKLLRYVTYPYIIPSMSDFLLTVLKSSLCLPFIGGRKYRPSVVNKYGRFQQD